MKYSYIDRSLPDRCVNVSNLKTHSNFRAVSYSFFTLKFMNIALFTSRCGFMIGIAVILSFPINATAQIPDSEQLPPPPAAEGYSPSALDYSAATGYRVVIPSDNANLLAQAKALEPTAFLQTLNGQRVIQVGLYGNESIARQQVARFQAQGMPVILQGGGVPNAPSTLPSLPPLSAPSQLPPISNTNNPNALPVVQTIAKGYYVIIPTQSGEVNFVQSQLNQSGIPSQYIFLRDRPFGIHYAIGVFSQRSQADKMASLIRSRGNLDARVHYEH